MYILMVLHMLILSFMYIVFANMRTPGDYALIMERKIKQILVYVKSTFIVHLRV